MLLDSDGYDELSTRAQYLDALHDADARLAGQVAALHDEVTADYEQIAGAEGGDRRAGPPARGRSLRARLNPRRAEQRAGEIADAKAATESALAEVESRVGGAESREQQEASAGRPTPAVPTRSRPTSSSASRVATTRALNPSSGAGGAYQILPSTWRAYGGRASRTRPRRKSRTASPPRSGRTPAPAPGPAPSTSAEPGLNPPRSGTIWIPTDDGAFVVNEPQGAPGWYPVNDNPRDKATYDFTISVPAGHTAIANGRAGLAAPPSDGRTTWRWARGQPDGAPTSPTARPNGASFADEQFVHDANSAFPMYDAVDPNTRRLRTDPPNPDAAPGSGWTPQGGDHRLLLRPVRRLPVHQRRRDHRLGAGRRLCARVADAGQLPPHPRAAGALDRRPRDRAPVVRQRGDARDLARHLAQRGLRDLLRVDLRRAARRAERRGDLRRPLRDPGGRPVLRGALVPGAGRAAPPEPALPHAGLRPRRDDAAGAAREGRRRRPSSRILRAWYAENRVRRTSRRRTRPSRASSASTRPRA